MLNDAVYSILTWNSSQFIKTSESYVLVCQQCFFFFRNKFIQLQYLGKSKFWWKKFYHSHMHSQCKYNFLHRKSLFTKQQTFRNIKICKEIQFSCINLYETINVSWDCCVFVWCKLLTSPLINLLCHLVPRSCSLVRPC